MNTTDVALSEHRFGLDGLAAKTLEQVSELIDVTRERADQSEVAALAKLSRAFNKLRQYGSDPSPIELQLLATA